MSFKSLFNLQVLTQSFIFLILFMGIRLRGIWVSYNLDCADSIIMVQFNKPLSPVFPRVGSWPRGLMRHHVNHCVKASDSAFLLQEAYFGCLLEYVNNLWYLMPGIINFWRLQNGNILNFFISWNNSLKRSFYSSTILCTVLYFI